jgi:hypothetical protein
VLCLCRVTLRRSAPYRAAAAAGSTVPSRCGLWNASLTSHRPPLLAARVLLHGLFWSRPLCVAAHAHPRLPPLLVLAPPAPVVPLDSARVTLGCQFPVLSKCVQGNCLRFPTATAACGPSTPGVAARSRVLLRMPRSCCCWRGRICFQAASLHRPDSSRRFKLHPTRDSLSRFPTSPARPCRPDLASL